MDRRDFLRMLGLSTALAPAALAWLADDLQVALRAAARADEPLTLPAGTWVVSRTLEVGPAGVRGAGVGRTVLQAAPGLAGPVLASADGQPFALEELTVEGRVHTRVGRRGRFVRVG